MAEFKNLRVSKRVHRKLATLDFRRTDFQHFRKPLGKVTWEKALEGERGGQESWSVFKDHLLQAQKQCILRKRKAGKNARRPPWINKELPYLRSERKPIESGSRNRLPGRTTEKLSEQLGVRLGKLKPRQN